MYMLHPAANAVLYIYIYIYYTPAESAVTEAVLFVAGVVAAVADTVAVPAGFEPRRTLSKERMIVRKCC